MLPKEIGYVAGRDRRSCRKRQKKLLEEIGYVVETVISSVAQQLLCACITADMRMHNTCCACGSQLLYTNYYPDLRHALINQEISLINIKRGLATASPQDERDISVDLVNNEANHFALYL